jgi:hypothetical protein
LFIRRACDFFDLLVFSAYPTSCISSLDKAVILSEALRRSIANRGLCGAESKDPGDACWQMLLGAFRPQTTTEDKKVTDSERSRGICGSADLSWKRGILYANKTVISPAPVCRGICGFHLLLTQTLKLRFLLGPCRYGAAIEDGED